MIAGSKSIFIGRLSFFGFFHPIRTFIRLTNSFSFWYFDRISLRTLNTKHETPRIMKEVLMTNDHLYQEVADRIEQLIAKRALKVGDKLLSVRSLSKEQGISLSTAFQAYYHLESKGLVEARPQSGYYVKFSPQHTLEVPVCCEPAEEAVPVSIDDMISSVYKDLRSEKL